VGMLERVNDNFQNAVHDARVFSTELIDEAAQKWSKDRATQEPSDKKS
jgi:hypothetical protein